MRGFATDAGSRTLSHRDPRALARSARPSSACTTPAVSSQAGQLVVLDGDGQRGHPRSGRGRPARAGRRGSDDRRPARQSGRGAPAAGDDGRRRADSPRGEHRVSGRPRGGPLRRCGGHRALPVGVPADARRRATLRTRTAVRDLPRHARGDGAGPGHRPHVRRRRGAAGVRARRVARCRRLGRRRSTRQPAGAARPAPEPDAARAVPGAAARAAARGAARHAAHHVSVRVGRRAAARGAAR